jgi:hypothetical protein
MMVAMIDRSVRMVGAVIAMVAAGILALALYSQSTPPAGVSIKASPAVSFRLMFGPDETQPATWDGDIQLSDGEVAGIEGWLFTANDAIKGRTPGRRHRATRPRVTAKKCSRSRTDRSIPMACS